MVPLEKGENLSSKGMKIDVLQQELDALATSLVSLKNTGKMWNYIH